jgi:hypothetical protein
VYANVNNLTNHANLVGYSGIMTSPFFMTPTAGESAQLDVGMKSPTRASSSGSRTGACEETRLRAGPDVSHGEG